MKIGQFEPKTITPTTTGGGERKASVGSSPPAAEASAQVELSAAASVMTGVGADATFDANKVERIAKAIREGKFEINAEAIADKLIQNAQELLGSKNKLS